MTIIGALRHRITIQQLTVSQDAAGGTVSSWSTFATVWGAVEPLSGREFWQAQQANSEVQGRIRIRNLAGVKPEMRIVFGTRTYEILSIVQPEQRPIEIHLLYKEAIDS